MLARRKGFTLIEIVIVLAIAALIMVIVFLAVQGAQRSRRDTQTKNDVNRIIALGENFASANNGNYPVSATEVSSFQTDYVDKEFGANKYKIVHATGTGAAGTVNIQDKGTCSSGAIVAGTNRGLAAATTLEVGKYCQTTAQ
jgi:prepilin-type N-terminal cleavage/methylation domain-containing protein